MLPGPALCLEKQRLICAYAEAVAKHNRMHSACVTAVLNGEAPGLSEELSLAEVRKENAKYAILAHQRQHGC